MHNIKIVLTTSEGVEDITFNNLDDTKKIFATFRAMYFALENEGADYSITLVNDDMNRLCRASRVDNVIMYAYNKELLPMNILATIPQ